MQSKGFCQQVWQCPGPSHILLCFPVCSIYRLRQQQSPCGVQRHIFSLSFRLHLAPVRPSHIAIFLNRSRLCRPSDLYHITRQCFGQDLM